MTDPLRAVFDTNVIVAAAMSRNPASPTVELTRRLGESEFSLLTCNETADEVAEKLADRGFSPEKVAPVLALLERLAEWVDVPEDAVTPVLPDSDDDIVLACAVLGKASHIVTYDPHFDTLGGEYQGIKIVKALPFLWAVRGDKPPEADQ